MTASPSITVSLDWAKKLKEAGWPQEQSLHCWIEDDGEWDIERPGIWEKIDGEWGDCRRVEEMVHFAAPTAEEILRRLPGILFPREAPSCLEAAFYPTLTPPHVTVGYLAVGLNEERVWRIHDGKRLYCEADTLANAAAAMWCYLAEQKLLPSA